MESYEKANGIIDALNTIILGKSTLLKHSIITLLSGGHLLLEDVPGVGKTTLAKGMATITGCDFSRIQFTPDTLPSDVTGVTVYEMNTGSFSYHKGAVISNIILADEINRTSPKTQASLLEAMEEHQVTVDGITHQLPDPFMVIATQNPIDYLGTYHLPEAQMDRFFMKLSLGYPDTNAELSMTKLFLEKGDWKQAQAVTDASEIQIMKQEVNQIYVHDDLLSYLLSFIDKTRTHEMIRLGASPRAVLAIIRGSQASAYLSGRDHVIPEDLIGLLKPMLLHRIILTNEAQLAKLNTAKVLDSIRCSLPLPVI